ncbi:hypothetical protein [Novosphingobium sp. KN65.2]|uniref:hypothetical protein n=1 Tax=Novosphingobium sp. KN65.2 TaxID=1478134 RepID=UPI0005E6A204|nr:hypothetical protein [Novosphingobium sp. KN65.2]CDO37621.1 hypothetical protein SPHV1_370008 [Novosphingobium sp. KN65.2]
MSRSEIIYGRGGQGGAYQPGVDVSMPVAGFYRIRLRSGAVKAAIRIWFGPPHDPVTGEILDRSYRWQATANGEPVDFDRVWPACAKDVLTKQEYDHLIGRHKWAREHAPKSAYADNSRKYDPLSRDTPLPF